MNKLITLFLLFAIGMPALFSQTSAPVYFVINEKARWVTPEAGKYCRTVKFDNLTADEIWIALVKDLEQRCFVPGIEAELHPDDWSIFVSHYDKNLGHTSFLSVEHKAQGWTLMELRIVDGAVIMGSPVVSRQIEWYNPNGSYPGIYPDMVAALFKKGKVQEKKRRQYDEINANMNEWIETLLEPVKQASAQKQ